MPVSLDALIAATRAAGMAAWPELELELDDDSLAEVLRPLADRDRPPRHLTDLYLVAGCLANRAAAILAFEASQMPVVERTVRKLGGSSAEIDEVKQQVRTVTLFTAPGEPCALANYRGDGSLGSWIRVVAMREVYRKLRAREANPIASDDQIFELMTASPDPELGTMKASDREQFRTAFRSAIEALPRRERTALRLNVLDGLSIDAIGKMFSVHRATAARWLTHACETLLRDTRSVMMVSLGIQESELDSILRLIERHLDISIATALGRRG